MKVHILYSFKEGANGGGNQFLTALRKNLEKMSVYEHNPNLADVILLDALHLGDEHLFAQAFSLKNKNKTIVQRIAGPMQNYRPKDVGMDKTIYIFNHLVANGTIFQSHWSRKQNYKFGLKKNDNETIIVNAPNDAIFFPKENPQIRGKIKLIASGWSSNPLKGSHVYKWLDENLDFTKYEMTFVGNTNCNFRNINVIPPVPSTELARLLHKHDIYIFASQIEACSNALLEAMHSALPVLAYDGSSNIELVNRGGELFKKPEEIPLILEKIVKNYTNYTNSIKVENINQVAQKYYDFMSKCHLNEDKKKANFVAFLRVHTQMLKWKIFRKFDYLREKFSSK